MKLITLLLSITILAACNSAQSDAKELANKITETTSQSKQAPANGTYLKATIDGKAWQATSMIPDMDPNSSYKRIHGEAGDISISFQLWKPQPGDKRPFNEDYAADFWASDGIFGGRKGEVVVTRADNQFVEGTFHFTASTDGKPAHEITDGSFRVQATPPPAN